MIFWIIPVLGWLNNKADDYLDFLRSIPSLLAPKPTPLGTPYTPPFTGGQSQGVLYNYVWSPSVTLSDGSTLSATVDGQILGVVGVRIDKALDSSGVTFGGGIYLTQNNIGVRGAFERSGGVISWQYTLVITRADNQPDSGGNQPNPNPAPSIRDDGLFDPQNPKIGDDSGTLNSAAIVLAPALPLVLVTAIASGYAAAMAAAQAATDALAAVKKIAEGLDALKTLWDKLKEFLDEWEKNRPSKRDIVRQTYGQILGDGAIDFFPNNNIKFQSIQLDVVITSIPIGYGRYFGSLSPSRYRFRELGYIAFYSANQGILKTHSIQFKRTSYQIPELAVGFIYHLGLDEQIKGFAFGTFSVEKT